MNFVTKLTAAATLSLFAFAANAQETMGPLDADGDGFLTEEEFAPIQDMGAQFVAYDSDGDGLLSQAEYNEGVRDLADEDGSDSAGPREAQRVDELTRLFDSEIGDRDAFLQLFQ